LAVFFAVGLFFAPDFTFFFAAAAFFAAAFFFGEVFFLARRRVVGLAATLTASVAPGVALSSFCPPLLSAFDIESKTTPAAAAAAAPSAALATGLTAAAPVFAASEIESRVSVNMLFFAIGMPLERMVTN
jgi:hypothetical protein